MKIVLFAAFHIYLYIYIYIYLSIYLSIYLFIYLSIYLSNYLPIYQKYKVKSATSQKFPMRNIKSKLSNFKNVSNILNTF